MNKNNYLRNIIVLSLLPWLAACVSLRDTVDDDLAQAPPAVHGCMALLDNVDEVVAQAGVADAEERRRLDAMGRAAAQAGSGRAARRDQQSARSRIGDLGRRRARALVASYRAVRWPIDATRSSGAGAARSFVGTCARAGRVCHRAAHRWSVRADPSALFMGHRAFAKRHPTGFSRGGGRSRTGAAVAALRVA